MYNYLRKCICSIVSLLLVYDVGYVYMNVCMWYSGTTAVYDDTSMGGIIRWHTVAVN